MSSSLNRTLEAAVDNLMQAAEELRACIISIETIREQQIPFWVSIAAALDMIAESIADCAKHIDTITGIKSNGN